MITLCGLAKIIWFGLAVYIILFVAARLIEFIHLTLRGRRR